MEYLQKLGSREIPLKWIWGLFDEILQWLYFWWSWFIELMTTDRLSAMRYFTYETRSYVFVLLELNTALLWRKITKLALNNRGKFPRQTSVYIGWWTSVMFGRLHRSIHPNIQGRSIYSPWILVSYQEWLLCYLGPWGTSIPSHSNWGSFSILGTII